jgi:hypothetical protein
LVSQYHALPVSGDFHIPSLTMDEAFYTLNSADFSFNSVANVPHIGTNLFHPQEDVERIFLSSHALFYEISRKIVAE